MDEKVWGKADDMVAFDKFVKSIGGHVKESYFEDLVAKRDQIAANVKGDLSWYWGFMVPDAEVNRLLDGRDSLIDEKSKEIEALRAELRELRAWDVRRLNSENDELARTIDEQEKYLGRVRELRKIVEGKLIERGA